MSASPSAAVLTGTRGTDARRTSGGAHDVPTGSAQ